MTRVGGWLVVLAAALALGLVLMNRMFGAAKEAAPMQAGPTASRRTDPNKAPAGQEGSTQTEEGYKSRSMALRPNQQQVHNQVPVAQVDPQATARDPSQPRTTVADTEAAIDVSVVGQPFAVSESILARCEPTRESYRPLACESDKRLLAEMAEEPREEPWATEAERAIQALVELEPGTQMPRAVTYTIRALECRTSICFVETASIFGGFHSRFYPFEKNSGLHAEYPVDSVETDKTGAKVHVTLWPFTRR